jgi:hypothetical protein
MSTLRRVPLEPTVYETAWNFTWLDGTPLYRDTQGEGLVYFAMNEPSNGDGEHYGGSWTWGSSRNLNDAGCGNTWKGICSIPRQNSFFVSFLTF